MTNQPNTIEAMLVTLEEELMASSDEDILAGPGAAEVSQRVAALLEKQLRPKFNRTPPKVHVLRRRDRRGHSHDRHPSRKRQLVDRVLVASPKARALVEQAEVDFMSEEELDEVLLRMRSLGLLESDDTK